MKKNYGDNWHKKIFKRENTKKLTFGELVLTPSKIYTKAVVDMFGGYDKGPKAKLHGVAHITGGGIPGKLGRVLKPSGLGAVIEPFEPSEFMLYVQKLGVVSDKEAYRTWNMGQRMIIATPEPDKVIKIASEHNIDTKYIGEIIEKQGITIKSKGAYSFKESELFFE